MFATIIGLEILCVAVVAGLLFAGLPLNAAVSIAAVVVTLSLVRVGGRAPSSRLGAWARHLLRRWGLLHMPAVGTAFTGASVGEPTAPPSRPRHGQRTQTGRALSVSAATGFRWDGTTLVCAARVRPRAGSITTVSVGRTHTADRLSVHELSPLLNQFDIQLAGIDLISMGSRVPDGGLVAQVYRRLIGPLPAISQRETLLLVRLDPAACPAAVARRGGGTLGAVRTAKVAAARIIRALDAAGFHSELLTPQDLDDAWVRYTGINDGDTPAPSWGSVATGDVGRPDVHTAYSANASALTSSGIDRLWEAATDRAIVSLRLRPAAGSEAGKIGLLIRYVADCRVRAPEALGLRQLNGQQLDALYATALNGDGYFDRLCDFREVHAGNAPDLAIATSGCGQLIGGDAAGNAVTVPVFGPGVSTTEIIGELYLARQITLRAMALGARVVVHTDRPQSWRLLSREVADPTKLITITGPAPPADQLREYSVLVVDGPDLATPSFAEHATVITVHGFADPNSKRQDVRIRQDRLDRDRLVIECGGRSVTASLVTIPDETRLIGQPEGAVPTPQAGGLADQAPRIG